MGAKLRVKKLGLEGSYLIRPTVHSDERGYFYRVFGEEELKKAGIIIGPIVQMNRSFNKLAGTFRGLHFQDHPHEEEKLVTCVSGSVIDIIVDLRKESVTFLDHRTVKLSQKKKEIVLIPKGCAHGFITLEENTELLYLHTNFYRPESEGGVSIWDPLLEIHLPVDILEISERDKSYPNLRKEFKGLVL